MKKYLCHVCKKETKIKLMPDYSSSGLWCKNCGVGFSNPKALFPEIPTYIIDLIQLWVLFWDTASLSKDISKYFAQEIIIKNGKILANLISPFYEVDFNPSTCQFFEEKNI